MSDTWLAIEQASCVRRGGSCSSSWAGALAFDHSDLTLARRNFVRLQRAKSALCPSIADDRAYDCLVRSSNLRVFGRTTCRVCWLFLADRRDKMEPASERASERTNERVNERLNKSASHSPTMCAHSHTLTDTLTNRHTLSHKDTPTDLQAAALLSDTRANKHTHTLAHSHTYALAGCNLTQRCASLLLLLLLHCAH